MICLLENNQERNISSQKEKKPVQKQFTIQLILFLTQIMKTITKTLVIFLAILSNIPLFAQTEATAVVAADKMNVFYIGVDNPISVAVPGIASDKLRVTVNNGTITGSNGKYIVKVGNTTETVVQVAAEINPGEVKVVGESKFRVKRIPEPVACIGNKCDPDFIISKAELLKNPQIGVLLTCRLI